MYYCDYIDKPTEILSMKLHVAIFQVSYFGLNEKHLVSTFRWDFAAGPVWREPYSIVIQHFVLSSCVDNWFSVILCSASKRIGIS